MKHQILFVDDEPRILEGLKRMLRPMRRDWEMSFANGGKEALAFLEHTAVDVVVSDVRMPVINGVQLLTQVKNLYPHTIRILLSGQSDEEMTLSAIGPVHQYLNKPCDANILKSTITRACALRDLLNDEQIRQLVSQIDTIPSVPDLYVELEKELHSPECAMENVAAIMAKDVGMTAKILKLVNSAFFGTQQHISDITQAVMYLGIDTIKTLVLSIQIFQQLGAIMCHGFDLDRFSQHSLAVADVARKIMISEQANGQMVDETLAAAMLHDLGALLFVSHFPDRYQECLRAACDQKVPLYEAELQTIGITHAEVGAYLLGLWGLNTPIVEAVAYHHTPLGSLNQQFSPLTAVHVANVLVSEGTDRLLQEKVKNTICMEYIDAMGLSNRVGHWQNLVEILV